jgi:predicted AAA+ superfamily ATPase
VPRRIGPRSREYLDGLRVLVLNGPRQAGKTTLLRQLIDSNGGELLSLDDDELRRSAIDDPAGFIRSATRPVYLDEVQLGGDPLIRAVKSAVDASKDRGQFVLAGSTQFLLDPTISESLAGRAGVLDVLPFSESELAGTAGSFLDRVFAGEIESIRRTPALPLTRDDYLAMIVRGGFPEVTEMPTSRVRAAWFTGYLRGVAERDIRAMARVNEPSAAAAVLRALAALSAQQLVTATLAAKAELDRRTIERYVELLEAVFLIHRLRPWSRNPLAQAVRRPKVHLVDTGLVCHLLDVSERSLGKPASPLVGAITESFVFNELRKQSSWAETEIQLFHYRDSRGHSEVDIIAESKSGSVVAFEVKAALSVKGSDFRHIAMLRDKLGDDFVHGFVVYFGRHVLSFGDGLTALPVGALWAEA